MQTEFQAWYEPLLEDAEEAAVRQRGRGATATGRLAPHSSFQSVSSARGGGGGGGGGGRGGGEAVNVSRPFSFTSFGEREYSLFCKRVLC